MLSSKFRALGVYAPVCLLIMFMCMTTFTILPTQAFDRAPPWITPSNSCLLFQSVYNRTYSSSTEYGRTTDFHHMWECALWCGWVQGCTGVLMEWVVDPASLQGGCYELNRPCCHIYTYVDPIWGWKQNPVTLLQDTAIIEYYAPPLPYNIPCNDDIGITDMEPYYGLPYIWYDYVYGNSAQSSENSTESLATLQSNSQVNNNA